ncbi:heparin lyase I family protein [Tropicimonas sp. S265A]|uniref:heparin lyase I family protein n=1 Tax=Tropicimonas sp. S265A TaxID=3415134 RepID=UPI003C7ED582
MPDFGVSHLLSTVPDFLFAATLATAGLHGSALSEIAADGPVLPRDGAVFERAYLSADVPYETRGDKRSQRIEAKEHTLSDDVNTAGRTLWYAFSVYVDPSTVLPRRDAGAHTAKLSVAQFHQRDAEDRSDKPALMFYLAPDGDLLAHFEQAVGKRAYTLVDGGQAGDAAKGQWIDVVVGAKWGWQSAWTEFWVRTGDEAEYSLAARDLGPNTSTGQIYFKYGLYRSFLERDPGLGETDALAYYDAVRRGDRFDAVRLPPLPVTRHQAQAVTGSDRRVPELN